MVVEKEWNTTYKGPVYQSKFLYFITNSNRSDIKVGLTDDLINFAKNCRSNVSLFDSLSNSKLIYFEEYEDIFKAKDRFREVNKWTRAQKEKLIRKINPDWTDFSEAIIIEQILSENKKNPILRPGFNYN